MKKLLLILIFSFYSTLSFSAPATCAGNVESVTQTNYYKKNIKFNSSLRLKSPSTGAKVGIKKYVKEIVTKHTGKAFNGSTFDEAIEAVYKHIDGMAGVKSIKKADKYAEFAKDLNPAFEKMIAKFPEVSKETDGFLLKWQARREAVDEVKTIKYGMVERLSMLEEFKKSEFKTIKKEKFLITQDNNQEVLTHMGIHDYEKYVDSYIHWRKKPNSAKAKLFRKIDEGNLGILEIDEIRDINAYNLWPMYLKEHDMRHIHYGMSHPMALATVMQTARSKSHIRYTMMGGLYEGVDRIQYSHEQALNEWFSTAIRQSSAVNINRNMDLEESLMTIGLSSQKDLKKIAKSSDSWDDIQEFSEELKGWKPKIVEDSDFSGNSLRGGSYREDIDKMLEEFSLNNEKAELLRKELLENPSKSLTAKQEHFMKMQNYQLDSESPEIVIDGLRFKNDGRGHYYNDYYNETPLGIGDN
ncbi:MAG: hypothetical protein ACI9QD_001076 [Thermoproteota archaeon]|jgi:hypothetical protein